MSRKQNWYVRRYVRAVSGFLPCSGKVKKPLLDTLRAQAEEYIADGGDAAALEQRFGTPQQVAAAWVDEMDTSELLAELHIHRRIVMVVALVLAAVLVIFTGVLVWQQYMIHKDLSGWNEEIIMVNENWTMDGQQGGES